MPKSCDRARSTQIPQKSKRSFYLQSMETIPSLDLVHWLYHKRAEMKHCLNRDVVFDADDSRDGDAISHVVGPNKRGVAAIAPLYGRLVAGLNTKGTRICL